jgi:hypothetical protein
MSKTIRNFLSNEERASRLVVESVVGVVVVAFLVAVTAMVVLH